MRSLIIRRVQHTHCSSHTRCGLPAPGSCSVRGRRTWHEEHRAHGQQLGERSGGSIRGCYTAARFRTERASHLQDRKWLNPSPLTEHGGVRVGERRPVLGVSKLHPQRCRKESWVCTPALKRTALGCRFSLPGEPGRHWILRKTRWRADAQC